jgi:hypothetical protein
MAQEAKLKPSFCYMQLINTRIEGDSNARRTLFGCILRKGHQPEENQAGRKGSRWYKKQIVGYG